MKDNYENLSSIEQAIVNDFKALYVICGSYRKLAIKKGLSKGMVYRICHGWFPGSKKILKAIGAPIYGKILICPDCNKPHERKCWNLPTKPRKPREKKYTLKQVLMAIEYGHKTKLNLEEILINVKQLLTDL